MVKLPFLKSARILHDRTKYIFQKKSFFARSPSPAFNFIDVKDLLLRNLKDHTEFYQASWGIQI